MPDDAFEVCDRCHGSILDVGPGIFRDLDWDDPEFGYSGVPVCPWCGGLGVIYPGADFQTRVEAIAKLRYEYCPGYDDLPEPPAIVQFSKLSQLVAEVTKLVSLYPTPSVSFAAKIAAGHYSLALADLRKRVDARVDELSSSLALLSQISAVSPFSDPILEKAVEPVILLYSGDFENGWAGFDNLLLEYPNSSELFHFYGIQVLALTRNKEKALIYLAKATELEPKRAIHATQAGSLCIKMHRLTEAGRFFNKALACSDFDALGDLALDVMELAERYRYIH